MTQLRRTEADFKIGGAPGVDDDQRVADPPKTAHGAFAAVGNVLLSVLEMIPMTKARSARNARMVRSRRLLTAEQQELLLQRAMKDPNLHKASADMLSAHPEYRRKGPDGGGLPGSSRG